MTNILPIETDSPKDLLQQLHDFLSKSNDNETWYFRGQNNAAWPIKPKIWRDDCIHATRGYEHFKNLKNTEYLEDIIKNQKQNRNGKFSSSNNLENNIGECLLWYEYELYLLSRYIETTNRAGLPTNYIYHQGMIDDSKEIILRAAFNPQARLTKVLQDTRNQEGGLGFRSNLMPGYQAEIAALAQHHGYITRLIDFTTNPFIAAFFAAYTNTAATKDTPSNISIYALKIIKSNTYVDIINKFDYSSNRFLFTQRGVFLLPFGEDYFLYHGKWPSLEDMLTEYKNPSVFELKKYILSYDYCDDLLKLLAKYDYRISTLMPSYNHVTEELLNEKYNSN